MKAIEVTEFGGPEVLVPREVAEPEPSPGLQLVDVAAAGVNYADTHLAENSYLAKAQLPFVPGMEVAGTIADGRRVVALLPEGGGYAEQALVPETTIFPVPPEISDADALAVVLQGTTAWHILRRSAHLESGESVLVHAGGGGVGTLAIQLAKRWGASRVIASASTEKKRRVAIELGADAAVDSASQDLKAEIEEANGGKVDVILEMVGGRTFDQSLAALAPFGRLVTYGMASRQDGGPVSPARLMRQGTAVIGFWLAHSFSRPHLISSALEDLFDLIAAGELRPVIGDRYALEDARLAHEDLRARRTSGKLLLVPPMTNGDGN